MPSSQTAAIKLNAAERRAYALELRERGADYRSIARAVLVRFQGEVSPKYDERQAYGDVIKALEGLRARMTNSAEHVRTLELARLNKLMLAYYGKALQGDHKSLDGVLKIQAREALYLGLDKIPSRPDVLTAESVLPMLDAIHRVWNDAVVRLLPPEQVEMVLEAVQRGLEGMAHTPQGIRASAPHEQLMAPMLNGSQED